MYTLLNSEASDTWSTASAMIGRHLFNIIWKFMKRQYSGVCIAAWFLNPVKIVADLLVSFVINTIINLRIIVNWLLINSYHFLLISLYFFI